MKKRRIVLFYFIVIIIMIPSLLILLTYAFEKMAGFQELIAVLFSSLIFVLIGGIFFRSMDVYINRTSMMVKQMAITNNIEVEERTRNISFYDTDPKYYQEAPVVCYGLRYRFPRTATWSLKMPKSMKGEYPNGWNLLIKEGEIPFSTRKLISLIAEELAADKRLLEAGIEFDSTPEKVWAAFGETRNNEVVSKVFDYLRRFRDAQEGSNS